MRIPLSKPDIGKREIDAVTRVLRSGQLSLGPRVAEFEEKFAAYAGMRHAVAVSSGTAALHLAVKAMGIGAGDDVITTSFSFVASANCLLYERAVPVFADIQPHTLNLSATDVREIIEQDYTWERNKSRLVNRRSGNVLKAILPVHVFGLPCDMAAIGELAREYNLRLIEDTCEAVGAECHGRRAGTFGDAGVFAFYPNKQMTSAEGGMLVTNSAQTARLCRSLRNQGRDDDEGWLRHVRLGYNYRLSDLHCALGIAQLERVGELLAARERVAAGYAKELRGIPELALPGEVSDARRSWFVYVVQLQGISAHSQRDRLLNTLRARGIAASAYFPAIHLQPYFREFCATPRRPLPHTESAADRCLALPFFSTMTKAQIHEVAAAVREILAEKRPASAAPAAGDAYRESSRPAV
ncbi:MAG: DegT/DnrJ/EryC1/StrS family aminotransferase [Candidatus Acidiferrales bacterium]